MLPPSAKPYLVRAIYDWCLAEGHNPYLLVAETHPGVRVPEGHGKDGRITLNINPRAVQDLELGAERIHFSARFGAAPFHVGVPYQAIVAVFAAETHEGMVFGDPHPATTIGDAAVVEPAQVDAAQVDAPTDAKAAAETTRPGLRLVE